LSTAFESEARRESSLRRIQRFMAEYVPESDLIAHFIFKLLPHQPPYCWLWTEQTGNLAKKTSMYLHWL